MTDLEALVLVDHHPWLVNAYLSPLVRRLVAGVRRPLPDL
jgi:hypothetical protein